MENLHNAVNKPDFIEQSLWDQIQAEADDQIIEGSKDDQFLRSNIDPLKKDFLGLLFKDQLQIENDAFTIITNNKTNQYIIDSPCGGLYEIVLNELRPPYKTLSEKLAAYREHLVQQAIDDLLKTKTSQKINNPSLPW